MDEEKHGTPPVERRAQPRVSHSTPRQGFQHIIVCVDGSTTASACVAYALSLANTFDSSVTLAHVMENHDEGYGPQTTDAVGWEISRQEAEARLELLQKEASHSSGRQIGIRLEQGKPSQRIVALTRELAADLVVLCSNEDSQYASWDLGSTAQQVLAAASSSVLIARGSIVPTTFVPPKRILVPLDGSQRTESVLPTAERLAKAYAAQLVLIHVVAEPIPTRVLVNPEDLELARVLATRLEAHAKVYLEGLRLRLGCDDSSVITRVERQADKRQFLVELSESEQIDLIVLSAHGRTCNVSRPFGSVTAHLLTHANVPVLVLQDVVSSGVETENEADRRAPLLRGSYPLDTP